MPATATVRLATDKQTSLIGRLMTERVVPAAAHQRLMDAISQGTLTAAKASESITWLLRQNRVAAPAPRTAYAAAPAVTEPGIYELDGAIYRVKKSTRTDRLWASVLTDAHGVTRLTEAGTVIEATYEYAPGAMRELRPEHRMTADRAEALSIVFTFCIRCSRHLKAAESVAAGIGPVCRSKI